jgi:hypothetical protein
MTVGFSTTNLVNNWLNMLRAVAFTAPTGVYGQLHIGDPGASGTANTSALTTRSAVTFSAASGGAIALSNTPSFTMTATETITHVSYWDAATSGNFLWSAALTTSKSVSATDVLQLTSVGVALTPLAA